MDLRQGIRPRLEVVAAMNFAPGTEFEIGDSATMGRAPSADVPIEDPFASSAHARIFPRGQFMYIEDMGSTNGTYLNGRAAAPARAAEDRATAFASARPSTDTRSNAWRFVWLRRRRCPMSGAPGRGTRTRSSSAAPCSRSPTAWAARAPARSLPASRSATFDDEPQPDASPEERLAAVATRGQRADLPARAGGRLPRGHGHDVHRGAGRPATRSRSATSATRASTAGARASSSG